MEKIVIILSLLLFNCFALQAEQSAQNIVAELLGSTSASPAAVEINAENVITDNVPAAVESELSVIEEPADEVKNILTNEIVETKTEIETDEDNASLKTTEEPVPVKPGILAGKIPDHAGKPINEIKWVLFSTNSYKEMKSTPGGNFGFTIDEGNEYTLTAQMDNQFFHTNIFLVRG